MPSGFHQPIGAHIKFCQWLWGWTKNIWLGLISPIHNIQLCQKSNVRQTIFLLCLREKELSSRFLLKLSFSQLVLQLDTKCITNWLELVESIISPWSAVLPDQLIFSIQIHLAALLKRIFHSLLWVAGEFKFRLWTSLQSKCRESYNSVKDVSVTIRRVNGLCSQCQLCGDWINKQLRLPPPVTTKLTVQFNNLKNVILEITFKKHRKNCECCPVSQLIVR